ncbi:MAG: hypothetical protein ACXU84_21085 [Xanthobacteraceae bacterium]
MDPTSDVLERTKVREVAAVFHSPEALEAAIEGLLSAGFDRADIDRLASLDKVYERFNTYVAPEEMADLPVAPRQPILTRDDFTVGVVVTASLLGAAAGITVALVVIASGGDGWKAGIWGTLLGISAGGIAALVLARVFRRDQLRGLDWMQFERGIVLWVRARSREQEDMAQEILLQNGGQAVRVHEIEIEKRTEDLPLSSLRPDPWLGSEPLGHP